MHLREWSKTKLAFAWLLLHLVYVAVAAILLFLATVLERPTDRGVIYTLFAMGFVFLFILYPLYTTVINATSVYYQISAMRRGESKKKNVIMTLTAVAYEIAVLLFWFATLERSMGV